MEEGEVISLTLIRYTIFKYHEVWTSLVLSLSDVVLKCTGRRATKFYV